MAEKLTNLAKLIKKRQITKSSMEEDTYYKETTRHEKRERNVTMTIKLATWMQQIKTETR